MQITTILVSLFLTWAAFDQNLFRKRRSPFEQSHVNELVIGEAEFQQKKFERHRFDVIPRWQRGGRARVRMKVNYFSTKPRDPRYSNQRKIRRMFNNL